MVTDFINEQIKLDNSFPFGELDCILDEVEQHQLIMSPVGLHLHVPEVHLSDLTRDSFQLHLAMEAIQQALNGIQNGFSNRNGGLKLTQIDLHPS